MSAAERDRPSFAISRNHPAVTGHVSPAGTRGVARCASTDAIPPGRATRRGFLASACALAVTPASAATHHTLHTHHSASRGGAHTPILHAPAVARGAAAPLPLVMLDPGHGGKDPGAIGVSGTYEKHIAAAAATELRRQLLATGQYRVQMTRSEDRFIPLEGRVEIAQDARAGLFVSMHADALHDPGVRGASVYTLSTGASDAQTAALARRENSADRFAGPAFHGVSPEIQEILASLVSEETRRGSAHMASSVVASFRSRIGLLTNPSRHAAFVVLKSAEIPSVLVEMGFMSNHLDEQALRQSAHRTQVASAMCTAIGRYFAQGPGLARMAG